jgi:hypothetical protein
MQPALNEDSALTNLQIKPTVKNNVMRLSTYRVSSLKATYRLALASQSQTQAGLELSQEFVCKKCTARDESNL